MAHRPPGPARNAGEDAPAWAVLEPVRSHIGAVVAGIEPQARDQGEHVGLRRVDAHPPAGARGAPAGVVLGQRIVPDDFSYRAEGSAVEQVANGARAIL